MAGHLGARLARQLAVEVSLHGVAHAAVSPRADHRQRNPARPFTIPPSFLECAGPQAGSLRSWSPPPSRAPQPEDPFTRYVLPEVEILLRVARTLTWRPADAEDLAQDTLLRVYQAIDRFDGAHPRAWLLTILRNTHLNRNRRRRPELLDDQDAAFERLASTQTSADRPEGLVLGSAFDAVVTDAARGAAGLVPPDSHAGRHRRVELRRGRRDAGRAGRDRHEPAPSGPSPDAPPTGGRRIGT